MNSQSALSPQLKEILRETVRIELPLDLSGMLAPPSFPILALRPVTGVTLQSFKKWQVASLDSVDCVNLSVLFSWEILINILHYSWLKTRVLFVFWVSFLLLTLPTHPTKPHHVGYRHSCGREEKLVFWDIL